MPKKKSTKSNKVKENAPYNICDRFCERCRHQGRCKVFRDSNAAQIKHVVEGRNPDDIKNVFRDLEKSFKQIKSMLKKMAYEEGINIEEVVVNKKMDKQRKAIEVNVNKHFLYKQSQEFVKYADKFLKNFFIFSQKNNPFLLPALNKEINDISFYFPMISAKIYRALSQLLDSYEKKDKFYREDINRSACLALNASLVCEKAVAGIMRETSELYIESMQFLTMLRDIRMNIKKTFPEAEGFRGEIIFNTKL